MRRLLILADDLSGAADCANACISSGLNAIVTFEDADDDIVSEVLSIDCDTRHLPPEEAAERVARIMRKYTLKDPDLLVFKKVDSTLRGNVGAEIRAVLEERRLHADDGQRIVAVMAPAFPLGGRTTIAGYQIVHGVPLHETEMWVHNGLSGIAHLPTMLQKVGLQTALLPLALVRSSHSQLSSAMQHFSSEADVLICDVENDEDLKAIAEASFSLGRGTIWAGSAGLAYQFPHAANLPRGSHSLDLPEFALGPILFVVGSMSSVSHQQAVLLERKAAVTAIHILPSVLLDGPSTLPWAIAADAIAASLKSGDDTLIVLDANEWVDLLERRRLTDALGLMLAPYANIVGALVATGGETARAILDRWGVASLVMLGDVELGLPYSFTRLNNQSLPVLTKAGAFGSEGTLLSCWHFLTDLLRKRDYVSAERSS
jgi:4-hydroxythreonine-4-phosphate dehydrogenase